MFFEFSVPGRTSFGDMSTPQDPCSTPRRPSDNRLIETWCRRCALVVAFRGPMGWLSNRMPAVYRLAFERRASLSGLDVAWLKRGANAGRSGIRHARHGPSPDDDEGAVDGGSDDRCRSAQGSFLLLAPAASSGTL